MVHALKISSILFFAAALAALFGGSRCPAAPEPSAREIYAQAVTAMSNLRQPAYVTYKLESSSEGLQVGLVSIGGEVWLNVHSGSTADRWTLRHRTYDYESAIKNLGDGNRYISQRSFFDPTWYGAYRALREGMFNSQDPAAPRASPGTQTPPRDTTLKTIAVVSVMGLSIYNVEDRGSAVCSNGDPGRALHLTSRNRDPHHQLSDVIVDMQTMRFCMMRFSLNSGLGFHGMMEQHYGDVGGYWMQTDGLLDGTLRALFISLHHGVWRYRLLDMQFPASLPPDAFAQTP